MSHRTLAVAALVAVPILGGVALEVPAAAATVQVAAAKPLTAHQKHIAAVKRRLHLAHLRVVAARKAVATERARVLAAARSAIGRPYVYGTAGPRSFDCSGLTQWAYKAAGKRLPRTTAAQARYGRLISAPRPGDLLVYSGADHVAIVSAVRAGRVVETIVARHSGTTITRQKPYAPYTVRVGLT